MITADQVERARNERLVPHVARRVKLFRKGRDYWGSCPFHRDKTPSFKIDQRGFFKCHGCGEGGDVITFMMKAERVSFHEAVRILAGDAQPSPVAPVAQPTDEPPAEHKEDRAAKARALWAQRRPIEGTPAERYLRSKRGYTGPIPSTLAFLPPWKPEHHPAMVARFGRRELRGVHLTLLKPDGTGKADVKKPKIMVGACKGSPLVLAPVTDMLGLAVTEGIEDGLSVHEATGLGVWAAGSAGFMPALADMVPGYIEAVSVYAHSDEAGQRGAREFAARLQRLGNVEISILNLEGAS